MTKINFTMNLVTQHTVAIDLPAYFKQVYHSGIIELYRIFDANKVDRIVKFSDGSFNFLSGSSFDPKILDYDLSSEQEFIDMMIEARDYLDNKIDHLSGYTKETEEDEPLSDAGKDYLSEADRKYEYEKEHFAEVTSLRNSG